MARGISLGSKLGHWPSLKFCRLSVQFETQKLGTFGAVFTALSYSSLCLIHYSDSHFQSQI